MALTKRTYVDGETIITAQNLNDIQNEIIAHESNKVPITRTVNSKELSSNITLTAANVGAVPTSRKVNNKQLSADITLSASDVGAAPTSHASTATTYGKGTSSNYGHVKISDSLTDTTTAATGGVVPSMKAVSDLNGAINDVQEQITPYIENGSTSSRAYSVGQYIVWKGTLCRVKTAISSGATFTSGTNLTPCSIGSELTIKNGTITTWNTTYVSNLWIDYFQIGSLVFGRVADLHFSAAIPIGSGSNSIALATGLPKASANIVFICTYMDSDTMNGEHPRLKVDTQGQLCPHWSDIHQSQQGGNNCFGIFFYTTTD